MTGAPEGIASLTRPLVLVGLMGAGKTTIGKRLAAKLGVELVDVDQLIEQRQGATVAELFARDGEAAFRALETAVLAELLTAGRPTVVATGGGAVLSAETRAGLRAHARVVWLRATPGTLAHRVTADGSRPLLGEDARVALDRLSVERAPLYEEVADQIIDVDRADRRDIVAAIVAALRTEVPT